MWCWQPERAIDVPDCERRSRPSLSLARTHGGDAISPVFSARRHVIHIRADRRTTNEKTAEREARLCRRIGFPGLARLCRLAAPVPYLLLPELCQSVCHRPRHRTHDNPPGTFSQPRWRRRHAVGPRSKAGRGYASLVTPLHDPPHRTPTDLLVIGDQGRPIACQPQLGGVTLPVACLLQPVSFSLVCAHCSALLANRRTFVDRME
jgi:hypothetical protein